MKRKETQDLSSHDQEFVQTSFISCFGKTSGRQEENNILDTSWQQAGSRRFYIPCHGAAGKKNHIVPGWAWMERALRWRRITPVFTALSWLQEAPSRSFQWAPRSHLTASWNRSYLTGCQEASSVFSFSSWEGWRGGQGRRKRLYPPRLITGCKRMKRKNRRS